MLLNLYRFLHADSWSKSLHQIDHFAQNHVLYNNIFVSRRYTEEYGVYKHLSGGVQVSGKAKFTAQD